MCICVDVEDGEMITLIGDKTVTARKVHKCNECRGEILPGQKYESIFGKCDGSVFINKTCAPCVEVRKRLMACGYSYGLIWVDINEAIDSIGIGDLDGLSLDAIGKFEEMTIDGSLNVCHDCNETIDGIEVYISGIDGPLCESCANFFEGDEE